jgi:DNA-binding CsgD family transcriptional regulator
MAVGDRWAEHATRLLGAAHAIQQATGAPAPPSESADYKRTEADARRQLGAARFGEEWTAGGAMSLEAAVDYALGTVLGDASMGGAPPSRVVADVPLSAREREVVELIAAGLSNRQISERLVLSVRTVERHIENVYNRLGISGKAGRAIVAAYAVRHNIHTAA